MEISLENLCVDPGAERVNYISFQMHKSNSFQYKLGVNFYEGVKEGL